jgi:hypothetical protein
MNERQANEKGYSYTGIYARYKNEVQVRLDKIRSNGYRAVMVTVPDSPYSRGVIGVGYSVYAERKYFTDKERQELQKRLLYTHR